jgi:DNA-binding response OmpR family regulator
MMTPLSGRLLIVDDNEMNRDMLARRLERKGYVVGVTDSAHQLLERTKQDGTDLVLLDIEMPEVSGLEALKTLREAYSPIELPIIMVTAKNQSEDIVKALDLGANDYLTKPVDFPVVLARIASQLSQKRAQEAAKAFAVSLRDVSPKREGGRGNGAAPRNDSKTATPAK